MIDLKKFKRVLTFFSHPDDETLAAGATLVKLIKFGASKASFKTLCQL